MKPALKISRAITKSAFSHPFWGSLMLSIPNSETKSLPTAATDGKRIMWNADFIEKITEPQTVGLMAHELCHIIFNHCVPHPGKNAKLCNIAMDYVINNTLEEDGLVLPEGGIKDTKREFIGMTWGQVYAILNDCVSKKQQEDNGDSPDYSKGAAGKAGLSEKRQKELGEDTEKMLDDPDIMDVIENSDLSEEDKEEMKRKIIQAAENAKARGVGKLPGGIEGLIKEIRKSSVDWTEYLITTMRNRFPEDYTFRTPNKKFLRTTGIYMPSMEGKKVGTIVVGLDTSGSVSQSEMVRFLSEMNEISRSFNPEKVIVLYSDYDVANVETYENGEEIDTLNTRGGGGTSFVPVFDYIVDNDIEVDQMIYFSDMEVDPSCFPARSPEYPVLFVSTRAEYPVPFGDLVVAEEL